MSGRRRLFVSFGVAAAAGALACGAVLSQAARHAPPAPGPAGPSGLSSVVLPVIWTNDATWPRRLHASVARGSLRWSDLRGSPVVLNFFASWCDPCRREAILLSKAARTQRGRIVFLAAAVHDYTPAARRFLRAHRLPFAAVTATSPLLRSFRLIGLPETFYLDAHGRVRTVTRGELTASALAQGLRRLRGG